MRYSFLAIFLVLGLSSCGTDLGLSVTESDYVPDPLNPNKTIARSSAERGGKLKFSSKSAPKKGEFQINKYLWDACLDVLSELPAQHIQPEVGIYETEYVPSAGKNIKIRCRIRGPKILTENLEVTVFEKDASGGNLVSRKDKDVQGQILLRARELKSGNV